jgi:hypothetical protein
MICWSELAREVDAPVYLTHRDLSFAGKPRSNTIGVCDLAALVRDCDAPVSTQNSSVVATTTCRESPIDTKYRLTAEL